MNLKINNIPLNNLINWDLKSNMDGISDLIITGELSSNISNLFNETLPIINFYDKDDKLVMLFKPTKIVDSLLKMNEGQLNKHIHLNGEIEVKA